MAQRLQRLKKNYLALMREHRASTPGSPQAESIERELEDLGNAAANLGVELLSGSAQSAECIEHALEYGKIALDVANRVPVAYTARLGDLLVQIGRAHEANWALDRAVQAYEAARDVQAVRAAAAQRHGLDSEVVANEQLSIGNALLRIGNVHLNTSEYAKALEAFKQSEAIFASLHPPKGKKVANALLCIGNVYLRQGEYSKALEAYKQSKEISANLPSPKYEDVADALYSIGNVYLHHCEYAKALEAFLESKDSFAKVHGPGSEAEADALHNIGIVYCKQSNYANALTVYRQSIDIFDTLEPPKLEKSAAAWSNVASVYASLDKHSEALDAYKLSMRLKKRIYGLESEQEADTLSNIGNVYLNMREYAKALEASKGAMAIFVKRLGSDSERWRTHRAQSATCILACDSMMRRWRPSRVAAKYATSIWNRPLAQTL
jgi:tetratricopeptide (TPR) repeat protein